jgi:hypothetical protein
MTEPTTPQSLGPGGLHHALLLYDSDAEFRAAVADSPAGAWPPASRFWSRRPGRGWTRFAPHSTGPVTR